VKLWIAADRPSARETAGASPPRVPA